MENKHTPGPLQVNITFTNKNPNTIANKLAAKLGREPTHAELTAEVLRIMKEARGGNND